jgi:hypothetical protein
MTELDFGKWQKQTLEIECENWKRRALIAESSLETLETKLDKLHREFINRAWADYNSNLTLANDVTARAAAE